MALDRPSIRIRPALPSWLFSLLLLFLVVSDELRIRLSFACVLCRGPAARRRRDRKKVKHMDTGFPLARDSRTSQYPLTRKSVSQVNYEFHRDTASLSSSDSPVLNLIPALEEHHRQVAPVQWRDGGPTALVSRSARCPSTKTGVPREDEKSSSVSMRPDNHNLLTVPSSASSRMNTNHIRVMKLSHLQKSSIETTQPRATSVSVSRLRRSASFKPAAQRPVTGPSNGHQN